MHALGQIIEELEIMQIVFARERWKTRRRDVTERDLKVEMRWGEALEHMSERDRLCDGIDRIPAFKKMSCELCAQPCTQGEWKHRLHVVRNSRSGSERKWQLFMDWIGNTYVIKLGAMEKNQKHSISWPDLRLFLWKIYIWKCNVCLNKWQNKSI